MKHPFLNMQWCDLYNEAGGAKSSLRFIPDILRGISSAYGSKCRRSGASLLGQEPDLALFLLSNFSSFFD